MRLTSNDLDAFQAYVLDQIDFIKLENHKKSRGKGR